MTHGHGLIITIGSLGFPDLFIIFMQRDVRDLINFLRQRTGAQAMKRRHGQDFGWSVYVSFEVRSGGGGSRKAWKLNCFRVTTWPSYVSKSRFESHFIIYL